MEIIRNLQVPTGNICVVRGELGNLECLSIGDYGQDANLKCDAIGLNKEIEKVVHSQMIPLEEKWVITISTQYGCSMNCVFCDVPKVGPGKNATLKDLINQVRVGISLHPEVKHTKRLNIHYARMGEPSWNPNVIESAYYLKTIFDNTGFVIHPVVSTMMPKKNKHLAVFINEWMAFKNICMGGEAGLQLSINSTSEAERNMMFGDNAMSLKDIGGIMKDIIPVGRKITLNFALAGYQINPDVLLKYFDPNRFIIKLTPMHKTHEAIKNNIQTDGDYTTFYPYKEHEMELKKAGYDVLVFIASEYEDLSRITCGNAILSGTLPLTPYKEV